MAVKRGRSQARRSGGNGGGLPGWAWMVLGIVLTIVVVLAAPKLLRSGAGDGFFRPSPNPDAQPVAATPGGDEAVAPDAGLQPGPSGADDPGAGASDAPDAATQYDFYTLLPGQEVAMTDAELAASARAEEARRPAPPPLPAPIDPDAVGSARPVTASAPPLAATPATAAGAASNDGARYILQAGSFGASNDAEALKARIALLGLSARVEAAEIDGRSTYRVRMGPYATATDLAEAKQKLGNGGLPALAIKAK